MKRAHTPINSRKGIAISDKTRELYAKRDKSLDNDPDAPTLPPDQWAHAMRRPEFFQVRPIKQPITARIDADVVAWLKADGEKYQTRLNAILRRAMEQELAEQGR
jgi:uncharacterized protein (DUF4415 family)